MICETCSYCAIIELDIDVIDDRHITTVYKCTMPLNVFCKEVRKCNKYKEEANVKKDS